MSRITASLKNIGNKFTGLFGRKDAGKVVNEAYAGTKENAVDKTKSRAKDAQKKGGEKYDNTKDDTSDAIMKGINKAKDASDSIRKSV